jgi:hypothetical protein
LPVVDVDVGHVWVDEVVPALAFAGGVETVFVAVDVEFVVLDGAELLAPEVPTGLVHHLVMNVAVVLPEVCVPVTVTGGVTVIGAVTVTGGVTAVGFELAAVFDELWVLAVPPLTVGSTLIMGWMLIAGWTLTVWMGLALWLALYRSIRPNDRNSCVLTLAWWLATWWTATG